jgi:hypothetical protein
MNRRQLNFGIALLLFFNITQVAAEDIDCKILKDTIASSDQDFTEFRGVQRDLAPDPELANLKDIEGFNYKRDEYATEHRLAAAVSCSVIVAQVEDPESIISEARYQCVWPAAKKSETQFAAIKKAIQSCGIKAQTDEDGADNYTLNIDRVESGEGWSGVLLSVDRQSIDIDAGASVSISHAVCQAKTLGGCDDTD